MKLEGWQESRGCGYGAPRKLYARRWAKSSTNVKRMRAQSRHAPTGAQTTTMLLETSIGKEWKPQWKECFIIVEETLSRKRQAVVKAHWHFSINKRFLMIHFKSGMNIVHLFVTHLRSATIVHGCSCIELMPGWFLPCDVKESWKFGQR